MFQFFERLVDPYTPYTETNKPSRRLWPFLRDYMQPFKKVLWMAAVTSIVVAAVELWLIFYMGLLVDVLSTKGEDEVWQSHGTELIWIAVFLLLFRPAIQVVDVLLLNNTILPNFGTLIRWRAHRHVLRQSVGWFENDFAGRIANRIMQTPPAAGEAIYEVFDAMAYATALFVGSFILLYDIDLRLMAPLLIWFVFYGALVRWTIRTVGPASKRSSDARSVITGRVVDSYTNIHSVKLFSHNETEVEYAHDAIENARVTFQGEMRILTKMELGLVLLNGALIVAVVGWALGLSISGLASVGAVAAAAALTLRLNAMTGWIMWAVSSFFRNLGVVSGGMETIAQPITLIDAPDAKELELANGKIEVKDLTHHYGRGHGGLEALNLTIQPGEKLGVVGRSGVGKSTLVKLLLRFYDIEAGSIVIDGQDISTVTQDSLRNAIGMVQQDSSLLHRSVRDNILYGCPDATNEQVIKAAQQAEAHDFILELQDAEGRRAYDAQVGERGVKLSGGQRQRISLARVILKDAPILLLDEATSALDCEVEEQIQQTLYGMMEGKTVIAIAHRLSAIAKMDRIIVIDGGKVVEEGTHSALLKQDGLYAKFWSRQSGGFINKEKQS